MHLEFRYDFGQLKCDLRLLPGIVDEANNIANLGNNIFLKNLYVNHLLAINRGLVECLLKEDCTWDLLTKFKSCNKGPEAGTVASVTFPEGYVHFAHGIILFTYGVIYFQ